MALYELTPKEIRSLEQARFSDHDIGERADLQRLLRQNIEVIEPGILVIAEEFCEWDESRRRIDLLGIDEDANLVVIELKRTEDGGHMELQAIRYAAMVSAMTFAQAVDVYSNYLKRTGLETDATASILEFLGWEVPSEETFGQDVRIVLVSAEFSKEITTSVLWLNDHGVDIHCVRLRPYSLDGRIILDVQQIVPLPEANDYTVQLKKKAEEKRQARQSGLDFSKYSLTINGVTTKNLTKRAMALAIVKEAVARGVAASQIADAIPPNRWISIAGKLTAEEFKQQISRMQGKLGGQIQLGKYFCEGDELFYLDGRTYSLTNQWSVGTLGSLDAVLALLPAGSVAYERAEGN